MGVVTGRVLDLSGAPVPGVWVYASPLGRAQRFGSSIGIHSDRDGFWWLNLASGRWHVRETGISGFDLTVSDGSVDTSGRFETQAQVAPDPTREDIARLMSRRKQRAKPVPEPVPVPEPYSPPPESATAGDVSAMLREQRGG